MAIVEIADAAEEKMRKDTPACHVLVCSQDKARAEAAEVVEYRKQHCQSHSVVSQATSGDPLQ